MLWKCRCSGECRRASVAAAVARGAGIPGKGKRSHLRLGHDCCNYCWFALLILPRGLAAVALAFACHASIICLFSLAVLAVSCFKKFINAIYASGWLATLGAHFSRKGACLSNHASGALMLLSFAHKYSAARHPSSCVRLSGPKGRKPIVERYVHKSIWLNRHR